MGYRGCAERSVPRHAVRGRVVCLLVACLWPVSGTADEATVPDWADVSAVFNLRCVMCHSETAGAAKGLRLDSFQAAVSGSDRGPVLLPGDAVGSELVRRLRGISKPPMPFLSRPLPETEIVLIENWIIAGLPNRRAGR